MLTRPRVPKPTVISASVTRVLATLAPVVMCGSRRPSPSPAATHSSWTSPARKRRRGRRNRPSWLTAGGLVTGPVPDFPPACTG